METVELDKIIKLDLSMIEPSNFNPRTSFSQEELEELAQSIKQKGVIQNILVRPKGNKFEIVHGERRFRGSLLAGMTTIPAVIRVLTDVEAIEIAITENLQRTDISPMDEAVSYKNLMEIRNFDVPSLVIKFGKSETYIRGRIRLNDLVQDFKNLFAEEIISVAIASEVCKYSHELQQTVFDDHFKQESGYNCWRGMQLKDLVSRIENSYTTNLKQYGFDKTQCESCQYNSKNYSLFGNAEKGGSCALRSCLVTKNTDYLLTTAIETINKKPHLSFAVYHSSNETIVEKLTELGYDFVALDRYTSYPESPVVPEKESLTKKEYKEAMTDYREELNEYRLMMATISEQIKEGLIAEYIRIGLNDISYCYSKIEAEQIVDDGLNQIERLELKDKRNKEISREKTIEDTKRIIHSADFTKSGDFTPLEEQLLYFSMLSKLQGGNYEIFNVEPKYCLDNEDKIAIVANLTEQQKTIIRRDFLVANLVGVYGSAQELLLNFTRQHLPEQLAEIEKTHNDTYEKRHKRLNERIAVLKVSELAV